VWKQVLGWLTNEITAETTVNVPRTGSFSAKINALVFSIEGKYAAWEKQVEDQKSKR
jgi:hypothetical protein